MTLLLLGVFLLVTLNQARKILGKMASSISDEQLLEEIKTTDYLSEIIWASYRQNKVVEKGEVS